ncbi:hypothetical protein OVA29_07695 [Exiguobacterium sp. SL14]|nr:hypothetical protein [Exiguobacterium sp. SL14]MCY1690595.1 hypothetical protein [Exiguobacterium sp. SL14]
MAHDIEQCEERLALQKTTYEETIVSRETQETTLEEERQRENDLQEQLRHVSTRLVEIQGALNLAKEREKHGTETKERLEQEVAVMEERVKELELELAALQARQAEVDQEATRITAERERADQALTQTDRDFDKEAEELRSEAFEVASHWSRRITLSIERSKISHRRKNSNAPLRQIVVRSSRPVVSWKKTSLD